MASRDNHFESSSRRSDYYSTMERYFTAEFIRHGEDKISLYMYSSKDDDDTIQYWDLRFNYACDSGSYKVLVTVTADQICNSNFQCNDCIISFPGLTRVQCPAIKDLNCKRFTFHYNLEIKERYIGVFMKVNFSGVLSEYTPKARPKIKNVFWPNENRADFILKTVAGDFSCSKLVLSERSDFYKAMFEQNWKESVENVHHLENVFVDEVVVRDLIHYIYFGNEPPHFSDTFQCLLEASRVYLMADLKDICADGMVSVMKNDNVMNVLVAAEEYELDRVKEVAFKWIVEHLDDFEGDPNQIPGWNEVEPETWKCLVTSFVKVIGSSWIEFATDKIMVPSEFIWSATGQYSFRILAEPAFFFTVSMNGNPEHRQHWKMTYNTDYKPIGDIYRKKVFYIIAKYIGGFAWKPNFCKISLWKATKYVCIANGNILLEDESNRGQFRFCIDDGGRWHERDEVRVIITLGHDEEAQNESFGSRTEVIEPEKLKYILESEVVPEQNKQAVDFVIKTATKDISCHKAKLCAESGYFSGMLECGCKGNVLNWVDRFHEAAVQDFLQYIYQRRVTRNISVTCYSLMELSHLCWMEGLKEICVDQIIRQLSRDNAAKALVCGAKYQSPKLIRVAINYVFLIYKSYQAIGFRESFVPDWAKLEPAIAKSVMLSLFKIAKIKKI